MKKTPITKPIEPQEPEVMIQDFWTKTQRDLAKALFCAELSDLEAEQFLTICERSKLDPFSRQIYASTRNVKKGHGQNVRWEKALVVLTGIDGLRSIAERSGEYRGQTKPEWFFNDGANNEPQWHDCFLGNGRGMRVPEAARVGVHRQGFPEPVVGIATYDSFVQYGKDDGNKPVPNPFWKKMPDIQLLKCAEATALRKAFPQLLGGIMIEEELKDEDITEEERETAETDRQQAEEDRKAQFVKPVGAVVTKTTTVASNGAATTTVNESKDTTPGVGKTVTPSESESATAPKAVTRAAAKPRVSNRPPPPEPELTDEEPELNLEGDPVNTEAADVDDPLTHICRVNAAAYKDKALGDIGLTGLIFLRDKWYAPNKEKIALDDEKRLDAEMILAAIKKLED